jgi:pyrroloquinoline quinone (PQQ) biosynthesis protein C
MSDNRQFITDLNEEVKRHPALNHSFLETVSSRPFSKRAWLGFAQQLYPHVHFFIPYMEELLLNTFDMNAKLIVAKILLDEYGEDAEGASHPELFRRFVRACGGAEADASLLTQQLDPATVSLVETHMKLCRDEHFLVGLGVIGTAHEFAITFMFPRILKGLEISGFTADEREFFSLHVDHDVEHSHMLEDAMIRLARDDEDRARIRKGAFASLACRNELWSAMERRMLALENQQQAPTTTRTLLDVTASYKNVPDHFWPA